MSVERQRGDRRKRRLYVTAIVAPLVIMLVACDGGGVKQGANAEKDVARESESELWTKTNTPEWVGKLSPKVKTAFSDMMKDESPLYTAIFCNGKSTKVYINRSEWKELTKFQATNHLMLAVLLPHTDDTAIEYLDDKSGEKLATFTAKQNMGSINVVHP